jgi:hypothetical protein
MNKITLLITSLWLLVGFIEWLRWILPNKEEVREEFKKDLILNVKYPVLISLIILLIIGVPLTIWELFRKEGKADGEEEN